MDGACLERMDNNLNAKLVDVCVGERRQACDDGDIH